MDIRKVIKKVLSEAVTGDSAAESGAKASLAGEKIKNRMASMGVNVPDIEHLFSIEQLKVEPFKLAFVLQKVIDKPQELSLPETEEFSGLAKVTDDSKNLTLDFKPYVNGGLSEKVFKIIFLAKEINTNLPGTDKTIKALSSKGKFYHIQIPIELINLYGEEDTEDDSLGESMFNNGNLILEDDGEGDSHIVMEITISDIELGTKGKAKRRGDIMNTFGRNQKGGLYIKDPKWDGKTLPVKAQIQTKVTDLPNKELQHYINTGVENLMLRKSQSDPNNIILFFENAGITKAIVIKILNTNKDLFSGPINVEIGSQALGDRKITDPFKATLQLTHR